MESQRKDNKSEKKLICSGIFIIGIIVVCFFTISDFIIGGVFYGIYNRQLKIEDPLSKKSLAYRTVGIVFLSLGGGSFIFGLLIVGCISLISLTL